MFILNFFQSKFIIISIHIYSQLLSVQIYDHQCTYLFSTSFSPNLWSSVYMFIFNFFQSKFIIISVHIYSQLLLVRTLNHQCTYLFLTSFQSEYLNVINYFYVMLISIIFITNFFQSEYLNVINYLSSIVN